MAIIRIVTALAVMAATANAFCYSPSSCVLSRSSAAISRASGLSAPNSMRAPKLSTALRMQTEDDKAKASGIALATVGLVVSKFSLLFAVLAGGAAVYAAKLPKEGDEGLGDTAKQVSLLVGSYSLKLADYLREKDEEGGYSKQLIGSVKEAIESAKSQIKQG